jgi:hypothetical protein
MQLTREFPANKSKQNQIHPSKKACISLDSLGRIGAFQGATANPNKKISRPCLRLRLVVLSMPLPRELKSCQKETIAFYFHFCKQSAEVVSEWTR